MNPALDTVPSLIASVRAELLKLVTARSVRALAATIVVLGIVSAGRVVRSAGGTGGVTSGTPHAWTQVVGAGLTPTLLVVLIGVLAFTGEVRHESLTPTFLVSPRRGRVVAAKILAAGVLGVLLTLALAAAAAFVGVAGHVLTAAPAADMLGLVAAGGALAAFWAWLGVAVGVLVRHQIAALAIPVVWLLVVETLVTSYGLGRLAWWLPGGAAAALTGADLPGVLPWWLGALLLTGYAVALTLPGVRRLAVTDIT
jgi:ABC-2 type transport system permease protein